MKRYRRCYWGRALAVGVVLGAIALRWLLESAIESEGPGRASASLLLSPGVYQVERVIDGDTLVVAQGHVHVRLQGIDSPEIASREHPAEPWSAEATAFTEKFVRDGASRVRVEVDGELTDHYGRALAFVWGSDKLLHEELVRAGLAHAKLDYDYGQEMKDRLRQAQLDAQRRELGVWSRR